LTLTKKTITKSGKLGAAQYETKIKADGTAIVRAGRDYRAGVKPTTAQRVWQIAADFGAYKTIAPSVLSVYVAYPDASDSTINTVRYLTFEPPNQSSPLPFAVEQLIELDEQAHRLA
jgi:hypothetical protein